MKKINKKQQETVQRKIIIVTKKIPYFLFQAKKQYPNLDALLNTTEADMFKEIIGISIEDFKYMVEVNFLNKRLLDRAIQSFSICLSNDREEIEKELYK